MKCLNICDRLWIAFVLALLPLRAMPVRVVIQQVEEASLLVVRAIALSQQFSMKHLRLFSIVGNYLLCTPNVTAIG